MPILARNGSRYSAWQTGLVIVPVSIGIIVVSNVASGVVTRRGPTLVLVADLICFTIALVLLTRIPVAGSYWRDLFPSFLVASLGMGCSFVAITIAALSDVSEHDAALASRLVNTSQQIGSALGVAVFATVANEHTAALLRAGTSPDSSAALVSGFQTAFMSAAGVVAFAFVLTVLMVQGTLLSSTASSRKPVSKH